MTYVEVQETIEDGRDTIIIPIGSIEQHGPHGVTGTDSICALQVARRVAEKMNALLAPLMPYGVSTNHMSFPGTISLSSKTLIEVVKEICRSLISHGFKKIFIVNGHMGNYPSIAIAARVVREETGAIIAVCDWLNALMDVWKDLPGIKGTEKEKWSWRYFASHSGLAETSCVIAHKGGIVRMDLATMYPSKRFESLESAALSLPLKIEEYTKKGSYGDPTDSSKYLGETLLEVSSREIVKRIKDTIEELGKTL